MARLGHNYPYTNLSWVACLRTTKRPELFVCMCGCVGVGVSECARVLAHLPSCRSAAEAAVLPAQGNQGYCMGFQPYLPVLNCSSGRILVNVWGPFNAYYLFSAYQHLMATHSASRQQNYPIPVCCIRISLPVLASA